MSQPIVDPLFNLQETKGDVRLADDTVVKNVTTALVIETALPLILTGDPDRADEPNTQFVPDTASLTIYGDEVTVSGPLSMPGRNVQIFARLLRAEPDGDKPPSISVNGADLPGTLVKPKPLGKGETPKGCPRVKVAKGNTGPRGWNHRVPPISLPSDTEGPGGDGESGPQFPDKMYGEPGKEGFHGLKAGSVFICCERTDFRGPDRKLRITAVGGTGGNGQPGQPGADGGDGGKGFDYKQVVFGYQHPTGGGNGGTGGAGGKGGRGGQGGDGGTIVVHCISATPSLDLACGGGKGGDPGEGGDPGDGGHGGAGGDGGVWVAASGLGPPTREVVPPGPDGHDGGQGGRDNKGDPANASTAGSSTTTTGDLADEAIPKLVSVSQLQMMFERTRAEYLVTEPAAYQVRLMTVLTADSLAKSGRNRVVLALVGNELRVRIFDGRGVRVVEAVEGDLPQGDALAALKQRFGMTIPRVLRAAKWVEQRKLEQMSAAEQREALVGKLAGLSKEPASDLRTLNDRDLAERGAVALFMLTAGVRGEDGLKGMSYDGQRNTLIAESVARLSPVGADQAERDKLTGRLQGLSNAVLVRLGLDWSDCDDLRKDLVDLTTLEHQEITGEVVSLVGYIDPWAGIGQRLGWVVSLLSTIPNEHPQKPLARAVRESGWAAAQNHLNGLDYFGKTPWFAPSVSLETYQKALLDSLPLLKDIEEKHDNYVAALQANQDATNDLKQAITSAAKYVSRLSSRKTDLEASLSTAAESIGKLDVKIRAAKPDVQKKLKELTDQVKSAFGLTWEYFFNCLSQLSFMNVNEPATARTTLAKVNGAASAAAMGVSQLGAMINQATNDVVNDYGEAINRKLILRQIETLSSEVSLRSELTRRQGDFLSDETSSRLLVELEQFRELLTQFYDSIKNAREVQKTLDGYIELVAGRNRTIDSYNMLARQLLDLGGEIDKVTLQKKVVEGELGRTSKPGLRSMVSFVAWLYDRAKADCVWELYYASRAYAFWALKPYSDFYSMLGSTPGAINYTQLAGAATNLTTTLLGTLEEARRTPKTFPPRGSSNSSMGRVVVLTPQAHPQFFKELLQSRSAEFELEPATKASDKPSRLLGPTTAAWYGDTRPDAATTGANPFYDQADVRLTKVRAWMPGMKTGDGNHSVTLILLGQEQFRTPGDKPYPARTSPVEEPDQDRRDSAYVTHNEVPVPFSYDSKGLSYDPVAFTFTPGNLLDGTIGAEDGDLGFPSEGDGALPAKSSYVPIGPFGRWRLVVRAVDGLDLSGLKAVVIDFHGFHQAFDS